MILSDAMLKTRDTIKCSSFKEAEIPVVLFDTRGQKRDIKPNFHDHTTSGG